MKEESRFGRDSVSAQYNQNRWFVSVVFPSFAQATVCFQLCVAHTHSTLTSNRLCNDFTDNHEVFVTKLYYIGPVESKFVVSYWLPRVHQGLRVQYCTHPGYLFLFHSAWAELKKEEQSYLLLSFCQSGGREKEKDSPSSFSALLIQSPCIHLNNAKKSWLGRMRRF